MILIHVMRTFIILFTIIFSVCCSKKWSSEELSEEYWKAKNAFTSKNIFAATKGFENLYRKDSNFRSTRLMLGKCYIESKEYSKAKQIMEEELVKNPSDLEAIGWLYVIRISLGEKPAQLLPEFEAILDRIPDNSDSSSIRGQILETTGLYREALENYENALHKDSEYRRYIHLRKSETYEKLKDYQESETEYSKAKALGHKDNKVQVDFRDKNL